MKQVKIDVKRDCKNCPFNVESNSEWCSYYNEHITLSGCEVENVILEINENKEDIEDVFNEDTI